MKKLLIHVCCAVCAAALVEYLKDKYETTLFYYNPNIHPEEEYLKRRCSVKKLAEIYDIGFIEGEYDKDNWFNKVRGLEGEPEGGKRCLVCFEGRLSRAASESESYFITTLALSPYKDERAINAIGKKISGRFLTLNELGLKREQLWQKTRRLSKELNFYHQKYCGCIFCIRRAHLADWLINNL